MNATTAKTAEPIQKLAYTRQETAAALGVTTLSVDRLAKRGLLRPSRALRRPLYSLREIERFLEVTASAN